MFSFSFVGIPTTVSEVGYRLFCVVSGTWQVLNAHLSDRGMSKIRVVNMKWSGAALGAFCNTRINTNLEFYWQHGR